MSKFARGTTPAICGIDTGMSSPESPATPTHHCVKFGANTSGSSKLTKMLTKVAIDSDYDDNESTVANPSTRIVLESTQGLFDLFLINPPVFKANGQTYAILSMHIPQCYNKD